MGCTSSLLLGTSNKGWDGGEEQTKEGLLEDLPLCRKHHRTIKEIKSIKSPCKAEDIFKIYCLERGKNIYFLV